MSSTPHIVVVVHPSRRVSVGLPVRSQCRKLSLSLQSFINIRFVTAIWIPDRDRAPVLAASVADGQPKLGPVRIFAPRRSAPRGVIGRRCHRLHRRRHPQPAQRPGAQGREVIPKSWDIRRGPTAFTHRRRTGATLAARRPVDIHLMVFGDSTATGYGSTDAAETRSATRPRAGRAIRTANPLEHQGNLSGATSKGIVRPGGRDVRGGTAAGCGGDRMIGANDVTLLNGIPQSARRLGDAVKRQVGQGLHRRRGHVPRLRHHHRHPQPPCWWPAAAGVAGWLRAGPRGPGGRWGAGAPGRPADPGVPARPPPNCSPPTATTRRAPVPPWPPSSCSRRCPTPWARPVTRCPGSRRPPRAGPWPPGCGCWPGSGPRRTTGVPAPLVIPAGWRLAISDLNSVLE